MREDQHAPVNALRPSPQRAISTGREGARNRLSMGVPGLVFLRAQRLDAAGNKMWSTGKLGSVIAAAMGPDLYPCADRLVGP